MVPAKLESIYVARKRYDIIELYYRYKLYGAYIGT